MPTHDPQAALTPEEARDRVAAQSFARDRHVDAGSDCGHERIGLEPEYIVVRADPAGRPLARLPLLGPGGVVDVLDRLATNSAWLRPRDHGGPPSSYEITCGGRITFEPGAQVEHSTAPHPTAAEALEDVERLEGALAEAFDAEGARLASLGIDLWWSSDEVPQQLSAARYPAMAAYFDKRGPHGRTMMRSTGSCQLNLDLCHGRDLEERWSITNLTSPLMTATFAASPGADVQCRRALAWQALDPTRTGFPAGVLRGGGSPWEDYAEAALAADVMLFQGPDGAAEPGEPGFRFEDWMRAGHPRHGFPTASDLDYHLTTLFFEVRPRRFLEMRAADALPRRWRAVPVVLGTGLVYCAKARGRGLERLEPVRARLEELWRTAAREGLRDPELFELASAVWPIALEGARRLPEGYFRAEDFRATEEFLDRFTMQRLSPSDELRRLHDEGGEHSLAWAAREVGRAGPGDSRRARA